MNTLDFDGILNQHKKEIDCFTNTKVLDNLKFDYLEFLCQEYYFMIGLMRFTGVVLSNSAPFAFNTLSKAIFRFNEFVQFLNEKLKQKNINISKIQQKPSTNEYLSYMKSLYNESFKEQMASLCMICNFFYVTMFKEDLHNDLKEMSSFLKNIQFDQICKEMKKDLDQAFSIEDKGEYKKIDVSKLISLESDSWKMCTNTENQ